MSGTRARLRRLNRVASDQDASNDVARVVIFDPAVGVPEGLQGLPGCTFYLPDNHRDPMPVDTTAPAASGAA